MHGGPRRARHAGRLGRAWAIALTLGALTGIASTAAPAPPKAVAAAVTNRYEPLGPCRIVDQRTGLGVRVVDPQRIVTDLRAPGCEIPVAATSILTTITVVEPRRPGYTLGYATGTPQPLVSQVNHEPGEIRANGAVVPVGTDGTVTFFRFDGVDSGALVVDVVGAFVPSGETADGRFVAPDVATRLLDTRSEFAGETDGPGRPAAGTTVRIPLPDHVPLDAVALAVNAVIVDPAGAGFLTLSPAGSPRPIASSLNVDGPGQLRSGATVVPVTEAGFDVFVSTAAHVVVDTTGWFTGPSAATSDDGLFVAAEPRRLVDTRPSPDPLHPGGTIELAVSSPAGHAAAAAMTSITMIRSDRPAYVTAHPAQVARGAVSTGNTIGAEIVNQFAVTAASADGVGLFSTGRVDVTVDLFGWFTGSPAVPDGTGPGVNDPPRQRVLTIGDSSHAGIERTGAFAALRGASYEVRGESCRRLVRPSCDLRGTGAPPTALETLRATAYGSFDVLVIQAGYNDQMPAYAGHARQVLDAARAAGFRRIVWMTHSRAFRSDLGGADSFQVYHRHNEVLRALGAEPDVHVIEWGGLARQRPGYLYPDGIHLRPLGGFAAADTISRAVAHATGQPCPVPERPGIAPLDPCPDPGARPPVDPSAIYDLSERIVPCAIEGPRRETVCRWDRG